MVAPVSGRQTQNTATIIDVPVKGSNEVVSIDCSELPEDYREISAIFTEEEAEPQFWLKIAFEYRQIGYTDQAIAILQDGLNSIAIQQSSSQRGQFHSFLASLCIEKARHAHTGIGKQEEDARSQETKEFWLQKATESLNDAQRLGIQSNANSISKGTISMMRGDKDRTFDEANRAFEQAMKGGTKNLFAMLGKARVMFTRKNYKSALLIYQKILIARPNFVPDPRIGIGLCFWELNMKEDALLAWDRAAELDEHSVIVSVFLGISWITRAFAIINEEAQFQEFYAKGLRLISRAYKSKKVPLAGIVLAGHMYSMGKLDSLQTLLETVLAGADTSSTKAEAFFWIGRGQHTSGIYDKANSFYQLAKQMDPDSLMAAMALGQLQIHRDDITDAKLTFESVLEKHPRCIEALAILGSIYAREAIDPTLKAEKANTMSKARAALDKAIALTDESKLRTHANPDLHFVRSMLADQDTPQQILRILEQAADIQMQNDIPTSPQILNNMAVLYHQQGNFELARDVYQRAIEECIKQGGQGNVDTDVLIATMTYNLGRCEEESSNVAQAREIYTGLLSRYPDYVEAAARLAYLDVLDGQVEEPMETIKHLLDVDPTNTEIRALFGWLLNRQKKNKTLHFNEDPERKHFNHTLKYVDNYERYSLVALGNFYIKLARDTRADSDAGKAERAKHYDMSIKFFERALHYDPKNAYAAQGLGIAFAEHKQFQKAITILSKVRETLKDESIFINMGHCLCELHQYSRAIENYETALNTFHHGEDLNLYQCLGRAWLSRGRDERNADFLREALRYAKLALALDPHNTSIQFNVAFIQFQFAEVLRSTQEINRSVADLEEAASGLNAAVKAFTSLAEHKQPPYPKADIVQRATMGRNTTSKQLERAIQQQKEYESKNTAKVAEAKAKREAERANREAAQEEARKAELARQAVLVEQRRQMQEEARLWADKRRQEEDDREQRDLERAQAKKDRKSRKERGEEHSDDDAEKKTRKKKKRKSKKRVGSDSEPEAQITDEEGDQSIPDEKPTKKRKLSKRFISAETINSEDDEEMNGGMDNGYANESMLRDHDDDEYDDTKPITETPTDVPVAPRSPNPPTTNQPDGENRVM